MQPSEHVRGSAGYKTLCNQQHYNINFSYLHAPGDFLLRDIRPQINRIRYSKKDGDRHIASTCMPNQLCMISHEDHVVRPLIGEEALWLQGFPIQTVNVPTTSDSIKLDLAGNMVTVPVYLALAASTFAALSWWTPGSTPASPLVPVPVSVSVCEDEAVGPEGQAAPKQLRRSYRTYVLKRFKL